MAARPFPARVGRWLSSPPGCMASVVTYFACAVTATWVLIRAAKAQLKKEAHAFALELAQAHKAKRARERPSDGAESAHTTARPNDGQE